MPIAFGYHPFFQLPGVPRAEWEITLPVRRAGCCSTSGSIPTGERAPAGDLDGPLGDRTFDDGYTLDGRAARSCWTAAAAGSRSPSRTATRYAQVFAPAIADVICFEPMTAPADALRHSPDAVAPGESFTARFSVDHHRTSVRTLTRLSVTARRHRPFPNTYRDGIGARGYCALLSNRIATVWQLRQSASGLAGATLGAAACSEVLRKDALHA